MRAIRCNQYGPPESPVVENLPDLEPPPAHVVIDVKARAVNFPDVLIIENKYQFKPPLPFTPGSEVAGIVRAVGADVTQFEPGARVIAYTGTGGFAEQAL